MGLIEQEIHDLRSLGAKVIAGSIDNDKAKILLGVYNQTAKRENMLIKMAITSEKYGKSKSWKRLNNMNLIDENGAIDCTPEHDGKVKCPEQGDKLISRSACLDYSGDQYNMGKCQSCDQFTVTRKYCLSPTGGA